MVPSIFRLDVESGITDQTCQRGRDASEKATTLQLATSFSSRHLNTDSCSRGNDWMYLALLITERYSSSGNSMLCETCLT